MNPIIRASSMDGPNRTATKANDLCTVSQCLHIDQLARSRGLSRPVALPLVIQLDVTIVNVALFRISTDFGATVADLQWVVDAYTLGFAALLLSAGVVADRRGSDSRCQQ